MCAETNAKKPIDVIFILSPGHSGSTLLDLLISGHSDIIGGGEFRTWDKQLNRPCTCGAETVWRCDFWQAVNDELKPYGYDIADIEQHGRDKDDFADFNDKLFRAMLAHSDASVILDSSKRPKRLRQFLQNPERFNVHIVLLARGPLGVLASNMRKGRSLWESCLSVNRSHFKQLCFAGKQAHFVSYEKLVQSHESELQRLMPISGLDFQPGQLHPEYHTHHNLGGNGMRKKPINEISADERWKTQLTRKDKVLSTILTLPARIMIKIIQLLCNQSRHP